MHVKDIGEELSPVRRNHWPNDVYSFYYHWTLHSYDRTLAL